MKVDGYEIDVLIHGFPGRMVCHGGLGWSTVALIRGNGHVALVDVGSFNMRKGLIEQLAKRGLEPADVTEVILTHSHYDHSLNWILFRQARIIVGARELAWSMAEPWGETPVPELYIRELESWPSLHPVAAEQECMPGLRAHAAPGHTPGHLVLVLEDEMPGGVPGRSVRPESRHAFLLGRYGMQRGPAFQLADVELGNRRLAPGLGH